MRFQKILSFLLIAFAVGLLFLAAFIASSALRVQDLAQYWAGAHLIRQNPYSETLVTDFERSLGYSMNSPAMVMRNPPSALALVLPLRYMNYNIAFAFWTLLSVLIVAGCARASVVPKWQFRVFVAPAFLCLLYGPTVALLLVGQIAVLVLLGVTLFLIMVERKRDWLAGAFLSLTFVKPHVVLLFLHCNCALDYSNKTLGRIPFAAAFARRHERRRIALESAYFCPVHRIRSRVRRRNHAVPQYRRVTLRHIRIPRFGIFAADRRARMAWLLLAKASFQLGLEVTRDGAFCLSLWLAAITAFPLIKSSCCLP